ncbi:MAG: CheR family methyltransferase [Burkholderiaceae bacterium]
MTFAAADREYAFSDADFEQVRGLIHEHAGIALADSKRDMVYSRLARRLRALGLDSFDVYLRRLAQPDSPEWQSFVNALTTNLTSFFREAHHFPILAEHLRARYQGRPLAIWCNAASTGEEPYSLAMTACEAFDTLRPPVRILASDIDTNVLAAAQAGVYTQDRVDGMAPERLRRFFLRGQGANAAKVRVRRELVELIRFRRLNLLDPAWPIRGPLDAIFCRNVMIYFDKATQLRILERFHPLLRADGLLFAGHSESFPRSAHLFELQGKTVYRPVGGRAAPDDEARR